MKQLDIKEFEDHHDNIIDLPFHDDNILGITFDFDQMVAVIKIQTYNWTRVEKDAKFWNQKDGPILEMRIFCKKVLELEKESVLNLGTIANGTILDAEIDKDMLHIYGIDYRLNFRFEKYELWEL
jgi:hypothetical protein